MLRQAQHEWLYGYTEITKYGVELFLIQKLSKGCTLSFLFGAALLLALPPACAQPDSPQPVLPEAFQWFSPPGNPLLRGAWVLGGEKESGFYALRVTLLKGGKIPPHTHPDTRSSTVLSGTLHVGFGTVEDESRLVAVPAGAVYVAPANVPHYLRALDGDVVYQENGSGPTATIPVR